MGTLCAMRADVGGGFPRRPLLSPRPSHQGGNHRTDDGAAHRRGQELSLLMSEMGGKACASGILEGVESEASAKFFGKPLYVNRRAKFL